MFAVQMPGVAAVWCTQAALPAMKRTTRAPVARAPETVHIQARAVWVHA